MANTINSGLMPRIIGVAREYLRNNNTMLGAVSMDYQAEAGRLGQSIYIGTAADLTAASVTAANTAPAPSAISLGTKSITLDKEYKTSFALTGKETQDNDLSSTFTKQIESAVAGLANQINSDLLALYYKIPYASGNSGTGFFASNIDGLTDADKQLTENKCGLVNRQAMIGLKDYAAMLSLDQLQNFNTRGDAQTQRRGFIGDVLGFDVQRDNQAGAVHTIGTLTGDPDTTAEVAAGQTTVNITCDADDTVSLKKGDLIEFGDGYSYAVQADLTIANSATGDLTIDRGLEATVVVDSALALATTACTYDASSLINVAGDFMGYGVAARLPVSNVMGYATQGDHYPVVDPVTGFPMLLSVYPQYKQVAFEVSSIYGLDVINSAQLIRLLTYSS